MAFSKVGIVWNSTSFTQELKEVPKPNWCKAITIHHTSSPSLNQRPNGFTVQHIKNIKDYYVNTMHWESGPHFFIDDKNDDFIFGMSSYCEKGIHAGNFNNHSIGIEVLGDYDLEDPTNGRGLICWENAANLTSILLKWLELDINEDTIIFHREEPSALRMERTCPGRKIDKNWFISLVKRHSEINNNPVKFDLGHEWKKWQIHNGIWCVPVFDYLESRGISASKIWKNLHKRDEDFYYADYKIQGAYYIGENADIEPKNCTWAPIIEVLKLTKM